MQGVKGQKRTGKNMRKEGGRQRRNAGKIPRKNRKQGAGEKLRSESARTEKENAPACACRPTGLPTAVAQ